MSYRNEDIGILIVEDDDMIREVIRGTLKVLGYNIVGEATDGIQAVEMTKSLQPHAVVMDIKMPNMDGLEATRRIYECCPRPVVLITAYETPELVKKASAAGVGAYLVKPPRANEMERAITIAMARFDDMMALRRLNSELQKALTEIKTLQGLIPICASCKMVRDDQGYWTQVEVYIRDNTEAEFSHGMCPDCMEKLYGEYLDEEELQA